MSISDDDLARFLASEPGPAAASHDQLTDLSCAELLVRHHGHDLRFCHPWASWLHWQGGRWQDDAEGIAQSLAKGILRGLLQDAIAIEDAKRRAGRLKDIVAAERAARIRGALELARSEPGIPVLPQALDAGRWLFNCENGTYDLAAAELRPHSRADLITRQAPVAYDESAEAPRWQAFLERVLPDPEVRQFLQRAAGYSLVGGNPAQILLILWGSGANGKSTFLEIIRRLFGDYGQQAPPETFLAKHEGIPNDVARLRGARFVAAVEIGEGRRLNEPLIKRMTGGDTMTARFMRSEYFEFEPQFTPWLATNHKPEIRGTDEAIWRRIRLVPFQETIPLSERDEDLKEKLLAELPGILAWALQGCAAWQADGLAEPPAVQLATAEYRDEQDTLGAFLADCCELKEGARASAAALYDAFQQWAHTNGSAPPSSIVLGRKLGERGFEAAKTSKGRQWLGLRLLSAQEDLPF